MIVRHLDTLDDRRLDPYRHLRTTNLTRFSGRFIAESRPLVRRLIDSPLEVESVLIDASFLEEAATWMPEGIEVLAIGSEAISELIGFHFHRGYLACGRRPLEEVWAPQPVAPGWNGVMLVGVQDPENMGSILRTCAALGIEDVLLGPECVDPFARRVLRVSMGNAFKQRFYKVLDAVETLRSLHASGVETLAACLSDDSIELQQWKRLGPTAIVLGNEAHGLPPEVMQAARHRLRIDMSLGTDSLNVSVAAAILLHYACRLASPA